MTMTTTKKLIIKTKHIFAPIDDIEDGHRYSIGRFWIGRPHSRKYLHIKKNYPDLAPSKELWQKCMKDKTISEEEYVIGLNNQIRKHKKWIQFIFDEINAEATRGDNNTKSITFLCNCKEGDFCHRYLVQAMFSEGLDKYLARTEYDSLWRGLKRRQSSSVSGKDKDKNTTANLGCEQTKDWIRNNNRIKYVDDD